MAIAMRSTDNMTRNFTAKIKILILIMKCWRKQLVFSLFRPRQYALGIASRKITYLLFRLDFIFNLVIILKY